MLCYIYDGSFDGLLTCIYEAYYRKEKPQKILWEENAQQSLLMDNVHIQTDGQKAEKVYKAIQSKISHLALKNVFYVFLSEVEDAGTFVYEYVKLGFKMGADVNLNLANDIVLNVHKTSQKVNREKHFMLGLIRFRALEGNVFYALIEPQYNILGLVAPHFAHRMANENWMIHDVKRSTAVLYNQKEWVIKEVDEIRTWKLDQEEAMFQKLWQQYFKSIAIKNRINPKLQKRNMPMRYWRYLVEKAEGEGIR
ncbi:TIGR03915 family putative DNA repair protein [Clostridiaceae bacterium 35-E11]